MPTNAGIRTLGVSVVVVAAILFATVPASASTSRPTWSAGDFWTYSFRVSVPGTTYNGTLSLNVLGTESVTLNGTSYPSYHVKGSVSIRFGSATLTYEADVWYSVATLAVVELSAAINITTAAAVTITTWGNPPQDIHWPLTAGGSWTSSTAITFKELFSNGTATYTYTTLSTDFSVLADTTITVPAGTFTTTPLKETTTGSSSYVVNYWSSDAGNSVRSESYSAGGIAPSGGYNLTSYRYQGGSFFTSVVFGVPMWIWLILVLAIVVAIIGVAWIRRRRPPVAAPPQWTPPQEPSTVPEPPPGSPP